MIEQLKENQEIITEAIDTLSKAGSIPSGFESWVDGLTSHFDPIEEKDEQGEVRPKEKSLFIIMDSKRITKSYLIQR